MNKKVCNYCSNTDNFLINTYKHYWLFCKKCGTAVSYHKKDQFLQFLPYRPLQKNIDILEDPGKIYDYFTSDSHKRYVINHANDFINSFLIKNNIQFGNKRILDISGGSGHFVKEFCNYGCEVALTEINDKAIIYAQRELGINTVKFDFEKDSLKPLFKEKFDIVLLGAAIMFCKDIVKFIEDVKLILNPNALVIQHRVVKPTLGVFLRTQYDDYNYQVLYQPDYVERMHIKKGFECILRVDEIDPTGYMHDYDANIILNTLYKPYKYAAEKELSGFKEFEICATDRRWSHMIFKLADR